LLEEFVCGTEIEGQQLKRRWLYKSLISNALKMIVVESINEEKPWQKGKLWQY